MASVFYTIVEMSIKAGIVIIVIMLTRAVLRKAPKRFSYLLWSVAAFRLCVPFSFESVFSIFGLGQNKAVESLQKVASQQSIQSTIDNNSAVISDISNTPMLNEPFVNPGINIEETAVSQPIEEIIEISQAVTQTVTAPTISESVTRSVETDWAGIIGNIIAWVWIIGVAAMLICGIVSYFNVRKKMETAILIEKNIYCSDRISSPFTLGFVKPKIYLPFGLSETETKCILAHERCHIKRLDHIVKPFAYILLSVHWFNPLCWLAFNRMSLDMEMSCDEKILSKHSDENIKKQYTTTLLSLADEKRFPALSPIAFNDGGSAKIRIKHALYWKKPKFLITVAALILCLLTLVACMSDAVKNTEIFEDNPYDFSFASYGDGTCVITDIKTDYKHKEAFEIIVPEKSPDGDTVIAIDMDDFNGFHKFESLNVPKYISKARFDELMDKIASSEKEPYRFNDETYDSQSAAEIIEKRYNYSEPTNYCTTPLYIIDPTIYISEYNRISGILTYFADYGEEDCFEDSNEFLKTVPKDEECAEKMKDDVLNYFYHSAKYVTKVIIPQSVTSVDDGIRVHSSTVKLRWILNIRAPVRNLKRKTKYNKVQTTLLPKQY